MAPDSRSIFVIDDDEAVRLGLKALLVARGFTVTTFSAAEDFLAALPEAPAGCIVADVRMPGMSGIELQRELRRRRITLPLVIITGHGDIAMAVAALKAGAVDFLEKPFDSDVILAAVDDALRGAATAPAVPPGRGDAEARFRDLTAREREVMDLVVAGHPNKAIAHRLGIALRTVEIHRARVMEKTGARSLSELVRLAIQLTGPS